MPGIERRGILSICSTRSVLGGTSCRSVSSQTSMSANSGVTASSLLMPDYQYEEFSGLEDQQSSPIPRAAPAVSYGAFRVTGL